MVIAKNFAGKHYLRMVKSVESRIPREMYPEEIGKRLTLIRKGFGLGKAEMADLLGIERTYWSRFENGKRAVSNEVAYLLSEKFGITLDFLLLGRWDKLPLDVAEKLRSAQSSNT